MIAATSARADQTHLAGNRSAVSNGTTSRRANQCRMVSSRASTAICATSVSTNTCSPNREARHIIEEWRIDYNTNRPHSSLNGLTPTEFAARPQRGIIGKTCINEGKFGSRSPYQPDSRMAQAAIVVETGFRSCSSSSDLDKLDLVSRKLSAPRGFLLLEFGVLVNRDFVGHAAKMAALVDFETTGEDGLHFVECR